MAEYNMEHTGAELDAAIQAVLDGYRDVSPVTARASDVRFGRVIVTPEGLVTGTFQGVVPPVSWQKSVTGDPAEVTDGMTGWPLFALTAELVATQEGSGTPGPDNVRSITGPTSAAVEQNGDEIIAVEFSTEAGMVCGGVIDFRAGTLTVTHAKYTFTGDETWTYSSAGTAYIITTQEGVPTMASGTWTAADGVLCDKLPPYTSSSNLGVRFGSNNARIYVYKANTLSDTITSQATWKAWLAANPVTVVYPLAEPVVYMFEPQEMPELANGENTFACDTGEITVGYYSMPEAN